MEPTVPNPTPPRRCPVVWCRNGHPAGARRAHAADVDTIDLGAAFIAVNLLQIEDADVFGPAVLRIHYGPSDGPGPGPGPGPDEILDIPRVQAAQLADVLAMLTTHTTPDFIAALTRGAATLGGES
ncbi:hypothetical protein ACIBCT_38915 [Streptosporangium sp. NPDC050855]|uniref:hypothetical protein n=1 Tax=Streptosporangium sp. NPDC050855 TaxID=3366194 RepID=UPI003797F027